MEMKMKMTYFEHRREGETRTSVRFFTFSYSFVNIPFVVGLQTERRYANTILDFRYT